jgi:predicted metal-dependent enzyme (double-stranded beta helix superfamily)
VTNPFQIFVAAIDAHIRQTSGFADVVRGVERRLRELLSERDWLAMPYRRAIEEKPYAQYLLHRPDDHAFSIVSFVWNPGQGSPIHDHCTWGVIGQYEGEEDEIRFRRLSGRLERVSAVRARPGDVSHVYPPDRDIHEIQNRSAKPTISIHVYGGDIGSQQRHVYDPITGEARPFVSGYDVPRF